MKKTSVVLGTIGAALLAIKLILNGWSMAERIGMSVYRPNGNTMDMVPFIRYIVNTVLFPILPFAAGVAALVFLIRTILQFRREGPIKKVTTTILILFFGWNIVSVIASFFIIMPRYLVLFSGLQMLRTILIVYIRPIVSSAFSIISLILMRTVIKRAHSAYITQKGGLYEHSNP